MIIANPIKLNTDALAYMGDAVYELIVREKLLAAGGVNVNRLHKKAIVYVKAESQAKAVKAIFDDLTEQEKSLVKRARNHRYHSKAKNADPVTYKWATAFEALVGYLYLADEKDRLKWVCDRAINVISESR